MKRFVLYTNTISPHQLPLAREIAARVGEENFRYIYTEVADKDHGGLGWSLDAPKWCVHVDAAEVDEWLEGADVLLSGLRCFDLFERRAKKGLKNYYMTERWLKPPIGILRLLHPRYFGYARRLCRMMESGAVVGLPIGIHAARDMARLCGLMHGDLRCLFGAPILDFDRIPGGDIWFKNEPRNTRNTRKFCLGKMWMWGYFVEKSLVVSTESLVVSRQSLVVGGDAFIRRAEEKIAEWLDGVSEERFLVELGSLLDVKLALGEYRLRGAYKREALRDGALRFFREFSRRIVQLSDGRCVYFVPDDRAKQRNSDNAVSWAEYAVHAVTSSGKLLEGKSYRERLYNPEKAAALSELEVVIRKEACMYRLIDAHPENDAVLFIGVNSVGARMEIVTRLDSFGNADANLSEVTVIATHQRKKKVVPPPTNCRPLTEVVETVAKHQAAGFSPSTMIGIVSKIEAKRKGGELVVSRQSLVVGGESLVASRWSGEDESLKVRKFESLKVPESECLKVRESILKPSNLRTFEPSNSQTFKLLWVGRLLDWKRVDTIIRAVGKISTRSTCSTRLNITLDIFGAGPEGERLKNMAKGCEDVIRFHGPVAIGEVRKLMHEHDVYVLASNGYEGWGAVVSEALEEGMKVIGTYEAGSSATMLSDEDLFHVGDWRRLAELIARCAKAKREGTLVGQGIGEWTPEKAAERLVGSLEGLKV